MKKGFTLVELLAVIIILGVIALISTPIVLNVVEDSRINAGLSEANLIYNEIIKYCDTEDVHIGENYEKICTNDKIKENIGKIVKLGNIEILEIQYKNNLNWLKLKKGKHIFSLSNEKMILKDIDRPNEPDLLDNTLTPIKYDGSKWIYADLNKEWYNYEKKEWANAVIVNKDIQSKIDNKLINPGDEIKEEYIDLWYVWIPRYKYQLFSVIGDIREKQIINIDFENGVEKSGNVKCNNRTFGDVPENNQTSEVCYNIENNQNVKVGDWYTHPAFTLGDKELEGIWFGKFEIGYKNNNVVTIPNTYIGSNKELSNVFLDIRNISHNKLIDSHMMKNMEWGAVAYLSHSKYGLCDNEKCINIKRNNNNKYISGYGANKYAERAWVAESCPENEIGNTVDVTGSYLTKSGMSSSTTQNMYGIYDMGGGNWEYVMGNTVSIDNKYNKASSDLVFDIIKEDKYIDYYSFRYYSNSLVFTGKLGDASYETFKWYDDAKQFPGEGRNWFIRGGYAYDGNQTGIFAFSTGTGSKGISTRAILTSNK